MALRLSEWLGPTYCISLPPPMPTTLGSNAMHSPGLRGTCGIVDRTTLNGTCSTLDESSWFVAQLAVFGNRKFRQRSICWIGKPSVACPRGCRFRPPAAAAGEPAVRRRTVAAKTRDLFWGNRRSFIESTLLQPLNAASSSRLAFGLGTRRLSCLCIFGTEVNGLHPGGSSSGGSGA